MFPALHIAISLLIGWLFADLVAGFVHWFEDRYLDDEATFDIFQGLASDNALHHEKPTAMLLCTKWENMRSAAVFAWPIAFLAYWLGAPLWLWSGLAFTAFGNLVHRFAHTPAGQLPRWIRFMQHTGLFISHEHHDSHHRFMGKLIPKHDASRAYCP